ncbi:hypothetical protein E2C01_034515 [Portunus trituberculatus]|uniref:Uncharacterized protein n=1 Tax=Portunus trituberculatus TaxID=210409 RepID=A0A5B7F6V7_PORTR|nr:hypothetical protein [Portunus trituberculatus]
MGKGVKPTSHHTTPRHITSHHITSHHITSHHTTPNYTTPRHATPRHTTPHHTIPRHATSHHTTPHHTTPRWLREILSRGRREGGRRGRSFGVVALSEANGLIGLVCFGSAPPTTGTHQAPAW